MLQKRITVEEAKQILNGIAELKSPAIFSVGFIKRTTGEMRHMTAAFKVSKGVKGVGLRFNPNDRGLFTVHDMQLASKGTDPSKCKRMINLEGLRYIKFKGNIYQVGNHTDW